MSDLTVPLPASGVPAALPGGLSDLQRQLPAIFDSVADGVTVIDRSGMVRFANKAAAELMGLAGAADLIGLSSAELLGAFEMLDEDGRPFSSDGLPTRRAFAGEADPDAVIRFRASGMLQDRWSLVRARLLGGELPEDDLVVTSFQDISALKRTELRLAFLLEASAILGQSVEPHEFLPQVARLAVSFVADRCVIDLLDASKKVHRAAVAPADPQFDDAAEAEYPWAPDAPRLGAVGELRRHGGSVHLTDVTDDLLTAAARDAEHLLVLQAMEISEVLIVPLVGRGQILGALTVVNAGQRSPMSAEEVATLEELGRRAGSAIDGAMLVLEAQDAVRVRDEFMASASHDMRTPLAAVRGFAQLARRHLANNGATDVAALDRWLTDIDDGAARLTSLVSDVMDATLVRGGQPVPLQLQRVDLTELVGDRVRGHQEAETETHRFAIDGDAEPIVGTWDPDRLGRVLDNVLGNAVKFSPGGGPIEVRLGSQGERSFVAVTDHGIGIARVDLGRIFTPMFRGANAGAVAGTGLGLAGSRRLIELMGGEITVQSRLGEGSTFTIWLPREPAGVPRKIADAATPNASTPEPSPE